MPVPPRPSILVVDDDDDEVDAGLDVEADEDGTEGEEPNIPAKAQGFAPPPPASLPAAIFAFDFDLGFVDAYLRTVVFVMKGMSRVDDGDGR